LKSHTGVVKLTIVLSPLIILKKPWCNLQGEGMH